MRQGKPTPSIPSWACGPFAFIPAAVEDAPPAPEVEFDTADVIVVPAVAVVRRECGGFETVELGASQGTGEGPERSNRQSSAEWPEGRAREGSIRKELDLGAGLEDS